MTGAAAGIGRATVHRLVDEGLSTVAIVDQDAEGASKELEWVKAAGAPGNPLFRCISLGVGAYGSTPAAVLTTEGLVGWLPAHPPSVS